MQRGDHYSICWSSELCCTTAHIHFTHADFCMAVCLGEFLVVDIVLFPPQKLYVCSLGNILFEDADSANRAILGLGTLIPPEEAPDGFGRSGCLVEMLSHM